MKYEYLHYEDTDFIMEYDMKSVCDSNYKPIRNEKGDLVEDVPCEIKIIRNTENGPIILQLAKHEIEAIIKLTQRNTAQYYGYIDF